MEVIIVPKNKEITLGLERKGVILYESEEEINIKKNKKQVQTGASYTEHLMANDYNLLDNKPSIENVILIGNKNFEDLGLMSLSNMELEKLLQ